MKTVGAKLETQVTLNQSNVHIFMFKPECQIFNDWKYIEKLSTNYDVTISQSLF